MKTDHLVRIAITLEKALEYLHPCAPDDTLYDLFRNAAIKSFELGLETGGKSLRRALKEYVGAARTVTRMRIVLGGAEAGHGPGAGKAQHAMGEVAQQCRAVRRVHHLGVELQADDAVVVAHDRDRRQRIYRPVPRK